MAGSTYPSTQWSSVKRFDIPCFAASDIVAGAVVRLASQGDWTVQMVAASSERPLGVARDNAAAGTAVAVLDYGNIYRSPIGAGGSFSRQADVGVVGTSQVAHPISGVTVTYPVLGQVTGTPSVAVGASSAAVWSVGQSFESTAIGDQFAYRVDPRLLSGLS